jgi:hypothetical protein
MRKSSKFIVVAGALAALAVPSVASANVAVDDGVGFVGKGDVQTALGGINDAAMQDKWSKGDVKFTSSYIWALDNTMACTKYDPTAVYPASPFVRTGDTIHVINGTKVTQAVNATAKTTPSGKLTNGWNLTGIVGSVTYGPNTSETIGTCPAGSWAGDTIKQVETKSAHSLYVNDIALPNTPVVEPVV